jgi:hypothetical protein
MWRAQNKPSGALCIRINDLLYRVDFSGAAKIAREMRKSALNGHPLDNTTVRSTLCCKHVTLTHGKVRGNNLQHLREILITKVLQPPIQDLSGDHTSPRNFALGVGQTRGLTCSESCCQ